MRVDPATGQPLPAGAGDPRGACPWQLAGDPLAMPDPPAATGRPLTLARPAPPPAPALHRTIPPHSLPPARAPPVSA